MEHLTIWLGLHARLVRAAWVAALLILAACNNGTDGAGPDGY
jgi:predicted small secreted protein